MADLVFPPNPYVIGVPITGDTGFFGRTRTYNNIKNALDAEHQNVVVVFGQRRIGKTSLLHQIARRFKTEASFEPIFFDLQGMARRNLGEVLYHLYRTVGRNLDLPRFEPSRFDDDGHFFVDSALPAIFSTLGSRKLLLLFDEFDVLGDEQHDSPDAAAYRLFPFLHDRIMHERRLSFVFVVGRRIEELTTSFQSIFKQAKYQRIGLLAKEDTVSLAVDPTKTVLIYSSEALDAICQLTGGHPYLSQLICYEIYNRAKDERVAVISAETVSSCVEAAMESGHGALNWFWDGLPRAERLILSAVASIADEQGLATSDAIRAILERYRIVLTGLELKDAPDRLVDWEMLQRSGPTDYRFAVEMVRRWIIKAHPLDEVRRDVDLISKRALRMFENAREAQTGGDLEFARDEYRRALMVNPNHSGAQLGLAQVLFELGDVDEAIQEFERAYAIDEMSARDGLVQAHLVKARQLEDAGQVSAAGSQYQHALSLAPNDQRAQKSALQFHKSQADRALDQAQMDLAASAYSEALKFDVDGQLPAHIASRFEDYFRTLEGSRNIAQASEAVDRLLALLPENDSAKRVAADWWIRRGDALNEQHNLADAVLAYRRALDIRRDDVIVQKLESVSAQWEQLARADEIFQKAMANQASGKSEEAQAGWLSLIQMGVLEHRGQDIPILLAEARRKSGRDREAVPPTHNTPQSVMAVEASTRDDDSNKVDAQKFDKFEEDEVYNRARLTRVIMRAHLIVALLGALLIILVAPSPYLIVLAFVGPMILGFLHAWAAKRSLSGNEERIYPGQYRSGVAWGMIAGGIWCVFPPFVILYPFIAGIVTARYVSQSPKRDKDKLSPPTVSRNVSAKTGRELSDVVGGPKSDNPGFKQMLSRIFSIRRVDQ